MADWFAKPNQTLRWADEALSELEAAVFAFLRQDGVVACLTELDPETGEHVVKVKLVKTIDEQIARKATEALLNAKHAFDQGIYAGCRSRNVTPAADTYFPWSTGPRDAEGRLRRAEVPQELWDVIIAQEPYPSGDAHAGGDDDARVLSQIANNKHTIGVSTAAESVKTGQIAQVRGERVESLKILIPRWSSVKNEAELVRFKGDGELSVNYELDLCIVLDDPRLGRPIDLIGSLRNFADKAKRAVEALEARCRELA